MKKLILLCIAACIGVCNSSATTPYYQNDTIVINYGDKGQVIVVARDAEALKELAKVDYNKLMKVIQSYADSARKQESRSLEVSDESLGNMRIEIEDGENVRDFNFIFDNDSEEGLISTSVGRKSKPEYRNYRSRSRGDDEDWRSNRRRYYRSTSSYFGLDIGLNTYLEDGAIPENTNYELRPLGSRYVALSWKWRTRLARSVYFKYGLSVNWFNFMFNGERRIITDGSEAEFIIENFNLEKTKLTSAYLNLPVMLQLGRQRNLFRLGLGGYVGYRLATYSMVKFDGDKRRDHDSFNVNPVRYGLAAELGFRRVGARLFVNYDLSPLFDENSNLPELNPLSFGIRF